MSLVVPSTPRYGGHQPPDALGASCASTNGGQPLQRPHRSDAGCSWQRKASADPPASQHQEAPLAPARAAAAQSARRHSTPGAARGLAESQSKKKFKKLQEAFERRLDAIEDMGRTRSATPLGQPGTARSWKEELEGRLSERIEDWAERLQREHANVQARADQALDLAAEASRACLVMARQLQEVSSASFCTVPQVQDLLQERLAVLQTAWKAGLEAEKAAVADRAEGLDVGPAEEDGAGGSGGTSSKMVAQVCNDLNERLGAWVAVIEARLSAVEQAGGSGNTRTQGPESASLQCLSLAVTKLEADVDGLGRDATRQREEVQQLGARLQSDIDGLSASLRELLPAHLQAMQRSALQAFGEPAAAAAAVGGEAELLLGAKEQQERQQQGLAAVAAAARQHSQLRRDEERRPTAGPLLETRGKALQSTVRAFCGSSLEAARGGPGAAWRDATPPPTQQLLGLTSAGGTAAMQRSMRSLSLSLHQSLQPPLLHQQQGAQQGAHTLSVGFPLLSSWRHAVASRPSSPSQAGKQALLAPPQQQQPQQPYSPSALGRGAPWSSRLGHRTLAGEGPCGRSP